MIISFSGRIGSGKDLSGNICKILLQTPHLNNSEVETFLNKNLYESDGSWEIRKWADKLKDIVCLILNCSREQLEAREFKETPLGEEWTKFKVVRTIITIYERFDEVFYFSTLEEAKQFKLDNLNYDYFGEIEVVEMTPRLMLQLLGTEGGRNIIHPDIWVNSLISEYDKGIQKIEKSAKFNDDRLKHGYNKTRIFRIYHNIKQRCYNKKHPRYDSYGGKNIVMCKEWLESLENFVKWSEENGYNENLTLDRINNDEGYYPENCRWATYNTQAINQGLRKDNTSGYKGVTKDKHGWRAGIQVNYERKFLGYFPTTEQASEAYEEEFSKRFIEESKPINTNKFIITDTRFPNELKAVKSKGGLTIRVSRPCEECNVIDGHKMIPHKINPSEHSSETALDNEVFDYEIINDGTISDLIDKIRNILIENKLITKN